VAWGKYTEYWVLENARLNREKSVDASEKGHKKKRLPWISGGCGAEREGAGSWGARVKREKALQKKSPVSKKTQLKSANNRLSRGRFGSAR